MLRSALAALWLVAAMGPLRGATLEKLSLDDMVAKSTAIVRGRVAGSHPAVRGSVIYTVYKVQVSERWKGAEQSAVEVSVLGGESGGLRQSFPGSPELVEGQEYVLFLWTSRSGITQILGMTQGMFELPANADANSMAVRQATHETMLEPRTGHVIKDERIEMRLRELRSRISSGLAKDSAK